MGVLVCERKGCDNVMCSRYSPIYGYLCDDCFTELVESGPETKTEEFMNSEKIEDRDARRRAALARFNVEFPAEDGIV